VDKLKESSAESIGQRDARASPQTGDPIAGTREDAAVATSNRTLRTRTTAVARDGGRGPGRKETKQRPKPFLLPQFCKGCGRCIEACPKDCIDFAEEIHPESGLLPVQIDLEVCNGCGLCLLACPEPFALRPEDVPFEWESSDQEEALEATVADVPEPETVPDRRIPLPAVEPLLMKGTHASAVGALLAGCRHFFGYPITPSSEGAELMARVLPHLEGVFMQAVSEVATVNHIYGCGIIIYSSNFRHRENLSVCITKNNV